MRIMAFIIEQPEKQYPIQMPAQLLRPLQIKPGGRVRHIQPADAVTAYKLIQLMYLFPTNPGLMKILTISAFNIDKQRLQLLDRKHFVEHNITLILQCLADAIKDIAINWSLR